MSLINLGRYYRIKIVCENCGKPQEVKINKGTTVTEAVRDKVLKCENCGIVCSPGSYQTEWFK